MEDHAAYAKLTKEQWEQSAHAYLSFREKGGTANDMIEIPAMKQLIGDICGRKVLDVGCGPGTYAIHCALNGATVTAVDISESMIRIAKDQAAKAGAAVDFRTEDAARMVSIPSESFDVAIHSIAVSFQMESVFQEISRVLSPQGVLAFSEVHPMQTGGRREGDGDKSVWIVDRYFETDVLTEINPFGKAKDSEEDYRLQSHHYTLEDYAKGLRDAGFLIETILEPKPDPRFEKVYPTQYKRYSRYPIFLLIRAIKASQLRR